MTLNPSRLNRFTPFWDAPSTLGADNIQKGRAAAGEMGYFVWAVASEKCPSLQINNEVPIPAFKAGSLWVVQTRLNG